MTPSLFQIRSPESSKWDLVALGEVMLRFDPGEGRVRTARHFRVWEGGGEYNVARSLRRGFGQRTALVSAFADNEVGRLLEDCILQGGVDASHVKWVEFDGVGRRARNGLNFTERGFGLRGALGMYDRGHTAASQMKPGDVDWNRIFHEEGARWLHCGGIFAALSETTAAVAVEAIEAARAAGTIVSWDLNYRPSLWRDVGGPAKAQEVNRRIASLVDVLIGNEGHLETALGFVPEGPAPASRLDASGFRRTAPKVFETYPNLRALATTLREEPSATRNDWGAVMCCCGEFYESAPWRNLEIMDRVGGGDSFAAGMIYALLAGKSPAEAVEYGAAHGALAMTTPGDVSMATLVEVEAAMRRAGARTNR